MTTFYEIVMDKQLIPPREIRVWVGPFENEQDYLAWGRVSFNDLIRHSLSPDDSVLEVGCGCGRVAIHVAHYLSAIGRYVGIDCASVLLEWSKTNLEPRFPNCKFQFIDVAAKAHNPAGRVSASAVVYPFPSCAFTFVFAISLFTHMTIDGVANYIAEAARVLRPGGRFQATYLFLNDRSRQGIRECAAFRDFRYRVGDSLTFDESVPEEGIAHPENHILDIYSKSGFRVLGVEYGNWSRGLPTMEQAFQDTIIAEKRP